ncbi:MAG: flagellin domain protein, partial [Clostridia bacterium]|nr:flagellin domain protein [Clostridia bacterium]
LPRPNADNKNLLDLSTNESANKALAKIDQAIETASKIRSKLGAYQNRLEHTVSNLGVSEENMTASLSRIQDADMALEMANYTQLNILSQAATSMLAQANQRPQQILQLLQR